MFGARVCGSETASIVLNRPSAVTLCAVPLKPTDNSLSLWCSCKRECKHAMSSSPGNGSPFTKHQRSGRIYARPRCTGSRKCISSALLDELAAFPRDDEWSGRGLSLLGWGKPEEENIDIWGYSLGLVLRSSNVQSQPSLNNRGDPNVPKS